MTVPFREEASEHHRNRKLEGRVLRLAPRWTRHAYPLLLWSLCAAVAFACLGQVNQFAPAAAVVRFGARVRLTAPVDGRVTDVFVTRGQKVAAGTPLVRFDASVELATRERLEEARFAATARYLARPTDEDARTQIGILRGELQQSDARLRHLTIEAPFAGVVGAMRVHSGQEAATGDEVVTLVRGDGRAEVVAMVAADFRPYLRPGLALRLEFEGLAHAYRQLEVSSVGDEAIGPSEVRRYLGPELSDAIELSGPVVLVHASLPDPSVESSGRTYPLHDGMLGAANLLVRRERIVFALIPGLRELWMENPP